MPIPLDELPEVEHNPYHPANDAFNKDIRHVQNIIMAAQRQMKPKHVKITKMHFAGKKNVDIAATVGLTPQTIGNVIHGAEAQRLLSLLVYIEAAVEGPTAAQRRAVLTRIMVDHEKKNPKIALAAVAEMNKMDLNKHAIDQGGGPGQVNITINQSTFPRTALDG